MKNQFALNRSFYFFVYIIFVSAVLLYLHSPADSAEYFVTYPGSGSTCSQNTPCDLQTAIGMAGDGDTVFVKGGETYYGTADNVIEITDSIMLLGGWDGASTGDIIRDPEAYPAILDGGETRRVVHISGSGETPTIDGFTITNGNATGLITDCFGSSGSSPDGCGGGIFIYEADPIISNNVIKNNYATKASFPGSYFGYGGGIYIRNSDSAEIVNNKFYNNTGSTANYGKGGGIDIQNCYGNMHISGNQFYNNFATTASSPGYGGGVAIHFYDGLLESNIFENNTSSAYSPYGSGIYIWYGSPSINGNTIIGNQYGHAVYLGHFSGIFQSNRVIENSTDFGIYVNSSNLSLAGTTLSNNIIEGMGTYSLYLNASMGSPVTAGIKHNTIVGKGASYGVYIDNYCTVTMINNIVSNHSNTAVILSGETSSLTQNNTLFYSNSANGELGTNYVIGDPAFKNFSESDYRIKGSSAAKDAGIDAGITDDIEGTERPKGTGFDIGAYELYPAGNAGILLMLFN